MATITVCDGCGRQSPDPKTGLFIANHWLQVRSASAADFDRAPACHDRLFCGDCEAAVEAAISARRTPSS